MKKNRTFEDQALHDVREAVKAHHERKGLQLSTSVYPIITTKEVYAIRVVHKPSERIWH